jgi:hypothetical protein
MGQQLETFICMKCETRVAAYARPRRCLKPSCGAGSGFMRPFSAASYALAGMEGCDDEREAARLVQEGEDLTAILRGPGRDVSAKAGAMEVHSPLFRDTDANPQSQLF